MKIDWNKKYTTIAVYVLLVMGITVLFYQFFNNLSYFKGVAVALFGLLIPFFYGFSFAYIFNPVLNWFDRKVFPFLSRGRLSRKACRYLGVLCTLAFGLAIVGVFFSFIVPELAASAADIVSQITTYISKIEKTVTAFLSQFQNSELYLSLVQNAMDSMQEWIQKLMGMLSQSLTGIINATINTTISITSTVVNVFVGIVISIYLWVSKETFFAQIKKFLYAFCPDRFVERMVRLVHSSNKIFSGFVIGKILDSLIIGILCYIGMRLIGIPYALLISVLVGVTNVIPYFGPFIGAIPSILLLLLIDPLEALWFAIFVTVLQQVDGNIIGPKILGDSTGLSAFWVIFAVTFFGGLFGFAGMLIGVPLFAVLYALVKEASENRLAKKDKPLATSSYASEENPLILLEKKKKTKIKKNRKDAAQ